MANQHILLAIPIPHIQSSPSHIIYQYQLSIQCGQSLSVLRNRQIVRRLCSVLCCSSQILIAVRASVIIQPLVFN